MKESIIKVLKEKKMIIVIFLSVFFVGFLTYAYGVFNPSFIVDSSVIDLESDMLWQYSIGRIFQPFYRRVLGTIAVPFLSQVFWLVFLSLSIYYLTKIFCINRCILVVIFSCILTTTASSIYTIAYSFQWNEIFSLALLLSVLSVYLLRKSKYGFIGFFILNLIVIGLYPSYVCASIGLVMMVSLVEFFKGKENKKIILNLLKAAIILICVALTYFLLIKILEKFNFISTISSYNSVGTVQIHSIQRYILLIIKAYYLFFRNIIFTGTYVDFSITLLGAQEIFSIIFFLCAMGSFILNFIRLVKQKQITFVKCLLPLIIIACLPLGFSLVSVAANGLGNLNVFNHCFLIYILPIVLYQMESENKPNQEEYSFKKVLLILTSFTLLLAGVFVVAFFVIKENSVIKNFACQSVIFVLLLIGFFYKIKKGKPIKETVRSYKFFNFLVVIISIFMISNNIIFANQQYIKYDLAYRRSSHEISKIVQLIDEYDEFDKETDKVFFYGMFPTDGEQKYIFTAKNYIYSYIKYFENRDYNFIEELDEKKLFSEQELEDIANMDSYPSKNCITEIRGIIIVKLSNLDK